MASESAAAKYLRELIAKFPKAGARTLARMAYRDNPSFWPTPTACLTMLRSKLGVAGKELRKRVADKTQFRKPTAVEWSEVIPEPIDFEAWEAVEIHGPHVVLILSDVHIPFHDPEALRIAIQCGLDRKATLILLNGDIFDHFALSRWEKDPRKRDFPDEVKKGRQFLRGLRAKFPKARIVMRHGNHEERFERFMRMQAPDLLGIADFEWRSIFELDKHKIELVTGKRVIRLGKLNTLHGHEFPRSTIAAPVNPARGVFLRAKTHCLVGHSHQHSSHSDQDLNQKIISTWSTGCLCTLHPEYMPINSWSHGFAMVTVDKDGAFRVDNYKIIDGKVW